MRPDFHGPSSSPTHPTRRRWLAAAVVPLLAGALCLAPTGPRASGDTSNITSVAKPPLKLAYATNGPLAFPPPSVCAAQFGLACYTPQEIRTAYDVPSSLTGAGQTIVIVDAYG